MPLPSPAELLLLVLSEDNSFLHELADAIGAERALLFRADPTHEATDREQASLSHHDMQHDFGSHDDVYREGIGIARRKQARRGVSEPRWQPSRCSLAAIRSKLRSRVRCLPLPPRVAPLHGSPGCPSYLERAIGGDEVVQVRSLCV